MSLGTIAPSPWFTGFLDSGAVNAGGTIATFYAGTDTPLDTWFDIELIDANLNDNPTVLDSAGRAVMYLTEATYKFRMFDADGNLVKEQDNVPATQVGQSGGLGEIFSFGGDVSSPITATSYPSGATIDKLLVGSGIFKADSANLIGTYKFSIMIRAAAGTTVTIAIVDLDDGAPDTPLATASGTSTTGELVLSGVITFAAGGTEKQYGLKGKVDAGSGYAWNGSLVRVA